MVQVRGDAELEGAQESVRQQTVTCQQNNQMDQVFAPSSFFCDSPLATK